MRSLIRLSLSLLLLVTACGEKKRQVAAPPEAETSVEGAGKLALRYVTALDSKSPGPEWIWISPTDPPTSEKQTVRSLAYYQLHGTFIQAFEMDWERGDPAAVAKADLEKWEETYPDGTFTAVSVSEDGLVAGFSFIHHSGHVEGDPRGCFTQYAFVKMPGMGGLVRVSSEGPADLRDAATPAFGIVLGSLELKTLP